LSLLDKKQIANEIGGIELYFDDSDTGINVLFFPNSRISISLSINRRKISNRYTDINWYIENLLLPMKEKLSVESFSFTEC
jgi:hypothetical protein